MILTLLLRSCLLSLPGPSLIIARVTEDDLGAEAHHAHAAGELTVGEGR